MTETVKLALIGTIGFLLLCGAGMATCNYQYELDSKAPIVETCFKHPATHAPRGVQ